MGYSPQGRKESDTTEKPAHSRCVFTMLSLVHVVVVQLLSLV